MKKIKLIFLLCIIPFFNKAQIFSWAQCGNGAGAFNEGMDVATDASSNVYIVGYFGGLKIIFGTYTLNTTGNYDSYLTKYDSNGNIQWAKDIGGTGGDVANAVCTDASGNVIVAGDFASFDLVIGTNTLVSSGNNDIFIAKFDANGNPLWATSAGTPYLEGVVGVSTDAAGNIYLTGGFYGSSFAIGSTTLINSGSSSAAYIAKYDMNGNPLWARGGYYFSDGMAVTTDAGGNSYVTGLFSNSTTTIGTYTLTNAGTRNMFLAKYDTNGNVLFARASTGPGYTEGLGVTTDAAGDVYVTGDFFGGNTVFGTNTVPDPGGGSMFLTKYDAAGNVLWVRSAGGSGGHVGRSVSTYTGGVYVSGGVSGNVSIFGSYTLTSPTSSVDPMYIAEYDFNGNVLCATVLSSGGDDYSGLSVDKLGHAYISGDFQSNPFVLGTYSLALVGTEDIFVTKFSCQPDVGIKVLNKEEGINIYPNPNTGIFNLKIENELYNAELILFNSLGQKVHEQKMEQGINSINITDLKKGLYNYILLQDKQKLSDGKVVVE